MTGRFASNAAVDVGDDEKMTCHKAEGFFVVSNARGLHTRPSAELVRLASSFKSHIMLIHRNAHVNAKSLLGILTLAATKGTKIQVKAEGEDAEEALCAILSLAEREFDIQY